MLRCSSRRWVVGLLVLFLHGSGGPALAEEAEEEPKRFLNGEVVHISDGDTLKVRDEEGLWTVRLAGVDTPESEAPGRWPAQPFSKEAREFVRKRTSGRFVTVHLKMQLNEEGVLEPVTTYRRYVGEVFVDGVSLDRSLVKAGLARWYAKYNPDDLDLARLEYEARMAKRGMWSNPESVAPWEWRWGYRSPADRGNPAPSGWQPPVEPPLWRPEERPVRVAFWHVRSLSSPSRDEIERRQIAEAVRHFDAVAITGVLDKTILEAIEHWLEEAGPQWDVLTSAPVGSERGLAERHGLFYRNDILTLRSTRIVSEAGGVSGVASTLATHDGRLDFTMVSTRLECADGAAAALARIHRAETPGEDDVLIGCSLRDVSKGDGSLGLEGVETPLKDVVDSGAGTRLLGPGVWDHLLIDPARTTEFKGVRGVLDFDNRMFEEGQTMEAFRAMSGRRPVWIELEVPP